MPKLSHAPYWLPAAAAAALLAFNAQAAMYKWVDQDGITHYTQQPPPPGVQGKTIAPPPPVNTRAAQEQLKKTEQSLDQAFKQRQDQSSEQEKKQQEDQARQQACDQARLRLQSFQRPRVNFVDQDGTRRRATEQEREQQLAKTREYLDKNCR